MLGLGSATASWSHRSSPSVVPASGGGGTRKSLPDEMIHVFHVPALGSTDCPKTGMAQAKMATPSNTAMNFHRNHGMAAPTPTPAGVPLLVFMCFLLFLRLAI